MKLLKLTFLIYALFLNSQLHAATLGIPSQYQNIQSAYNAAQSGDTIEIELPGTYLASHGFYIHNFEKDIEIKAKWPRTIIDLEDRIRFIIPVSQNVDATVALNNITLRNYSKPVANAIINIEKGRLELIKCKLVRLAPLSSSRFLTPRIVHVNSLHVSESLVENCGGSLHCSNLFIDKSIFKDNIRSNYFSFIEFEGGVVSNSYFSNNGSITVMGRMKNIDIIQNTFTDYNLNGILAYGTFLTSTHTVHKINFSNNRLINNVDCHVKISSSSSSPKSLHFITIKNNLFAQNTFIGLSIFGRFEQNNIKVTHNTFADNMYTGLGRGLMVIIRHRGNIDFQNNLFDNPGWGTDNLYITDGPTNQRVHKIQNNNFDRPFFPFSNDPDIIVTENISSNPLFVDRQRGDYHLTATSPCINTGLCIDGIDKELKDFDQNYRDEKPDIGCDEFAPHIYFTGTLEPHSRDVKLNLIGFPGHNFGFVAGHRIQNPLITPFGLLKIDPLSMIPLMNVGSFNSTGHFSVRAPVGHAIDISVQGLINNTLTENAARLLID